MRTLQMFLSPRGIAPHPSVRQIVLGNSHKLVRALDTTLQYQLEFVRSGPHRLSVRALPDCAAELGRVADVITLAVMEIQMWQTIQVYDQRTLVSSYVGFKVLPYLAAWIGGWFATWSLANSYLTHLSSTGTFQITPSLAMKVNIMMVAVPIIYLASMLPFGILATIRYQQLIGVVRGLFGSLRLGAAKWEVDHQFSIVDLLPGQQALSEVGVRLGQMTWNLRRTFIVYAISGGFIDLVSVCPDLEFCAYSLTYTRFGDRCSSRSQLDIWHL